MSADEECETAGTSSMMESTMMEGEAYYQPETTVAWTEKANGSDQLCRICASPNEYLIPIFSGEGVEHQLGMKIERHLPIQVVKQDKLPLHVCYQCASTLIAWHDLHMGCLEAEKKLRQMFPECEEEVEHDSDDDDKADNFYSEPMESEMTEDPLEPSTSAASKPNRPTRSPRKKTVTKAKLKLNKSSNLLEPKEEQTDPDPASERCDQEMFLPLDIINEPDEAIGMDEKRYTCFTCHKKYTRLSYFNLHCKKHEKEVKLYGSGKAMVLTQHRFRCDVCQRGFRLKRAVIRHMVVDHRFLQRHVYECRTCGQVLESSRLRREHMRSTHAKVKSRAVECVPCYVCRRRIGTKRMRLHLYRVHNVGTLAALLADRAASGRGEKVLSTLGAGNETVTNVTDDCELQTIDVTSSPQPSAVEHKTDVEIVYKCKTCSKTYTALLHYNRHLKKHEREVKAFGSNAALLYSQHPYQCNICQQGFLLKAAIAKHMIVDHHFKSREHYKCSSCNDAFDSLPTLKKHRYIAHIKKKVQSYVQRIPCEMCGRLYREQYLPLHLGIVHNVGPKRYTCEQCGEQFPCDYKYKAHMELHTGTRDHICDKCGASYVTRSQLSSHIQSHATTLAFSCQPCGVAFKHRQSLRRHEAEVHEGRVPVSKRRVHACNVCGKEFCSSSVLKKHMPRHDEKRAMHVCHCGRAYVNEKNLGEHLRKAHSQGGYPCEVCGKMFNTQLGTNQHFVRFHLRKNVMNPAIRPVSLT